MSHRVAVVAGGFTTAVGSLLAQATPDSFEARGGLIVALTGLLTLCGAIAQGFFADRKSTRETRLQHDLAMAKIQLNAAAVRQLYRWATIAHEKHPDLPEPPEVELTGDTALELPVLADPKTPPPA